MTVFLASGGSVAVALLAASIAMSWHWIVRVEHRWGRSARKGRQQAGDFAEALDRWFGATR